MKKQPNTNQHYIPQCYFRNFSSNNKSIYVYDKNLGRSFPNPIAIDKICCKDDYYSLLAKNVDTNKSKREKELIIEKDFFADDIETKFGILLKRIISNKDEWIQDNNTSAISDEEKQELSELIAIQFLRLPNKRDDLISSFEGDFMKDVIKIFQMGLSIETGNKSIENLQIIPKVESHSQLHAVKLFCNQEIIDEFTSTLYHKYWDFFVSTDNDILTSDNPIVIKTHKKGVRPLCSGLGAESTEISFPLSKNIVLVIWDKNYFPSKGITDCQFSIIDDKKKREYNLLRYGCAIQRIFGFNNEFSIVEQIKTINNGNELFYNYLVC